MPVTHVLLVHGINSNAKWQSFPLAGFLNRTSMLSRFGTGNTGG